MNEIKFHLVPELTPEKIIEVKVAAIRKDMKLKEWVKEALLEKLKKEE